ncbi:MAG: DUF134 domain-containing protein [Oscillospiraceae bacterium]|nr:DUF134 domain-containing protein [Oscillospiraceae bacterium]
MPRPCKKRRICAMPHTRHFGPKDTSRLQGGTVIMSMDEYECVRLIDLEGMTQEQCALQMQVARTTVQAIYTSARRKLAQCLVNEKELRIQGGDVFLCEGHSDTPCAKNCARHACRAQ